MDYQLRGNRVSPMHIEDIRARALKVAKAFKINKRNKRNLEDSFEALSMYGITLSVLPDDEWLGFTRGHYDPASLTITVPSKIYEGACDGEQDALFVMLHELGHLFLLHKAVLHCADTIPTQSEDAEWQADSFADVILEHLGYQTQQLSFEFGIQM
ncbi:ImmA/IrrE family metallo-endopeptidase [Parashewanella tropica]|uniref:ImmA/IrrE family metallo-endopeptidase n=1 Tax=Parashewanella tropica TaxID=2547970 RepID=UPI001C552EED|nr:ImmA/IrrE family metallo-endopeptidase [Parashewanella tropica]